MPKDENTAESAEVVPETSTETQATDTAKATGSSKETGEGTNVPYTRFKEMVDQRDDLSQRYDALESNFADRQTEQGQLIELLRSKDADVDILNRIREMGQSGSELEKELVDRLDKHLKGDVEEEALPAEAGEKATKSSADEKTVKLLKETREELTERAADQQADLLLMKADLLSEKYFDALPEQYTDQDKRVVGQLLVDTVDWEEIENNPDSLNEEVAKAFENTLELFGDPRGTVVEKEEATESTPVADNSSKPEQPEYLKTDWGELRDVKMPDGTVLKEQVHSEDDWRTALAQSIRDENAKS